MSYRAFKHLLGETSLERKCRFIFGGGILVLITASFYWYSKLTERMVYDQNLHTCRMMVNPILLYSHWINLETDREFRPTIVSFFGETVAEDLKNCKWEFLKPLAESEVSNRAPDPFEQQALEAFRGGESDEETRFAPGGATYQYLAAVRLRESCIVCHPTHPASGRSLPTNEGDLWRAISISMPLD